MRRKAVFLQHQPEGYYAAVGSKSFDPSKPSFRWKNKTFLTPKGKGVLKFRLFMPEIVHYFDADTGQELTFYRNENKKLMSAGELDLFINQSIFTQLIRAFQGVEKRDWLMWLIMWCFGIAVGFIIGRMIA